MTELSSRRPHASAINHPPRESTSLDDVCAGDELGTPRAPGAWSLITVLVVSVACMWALSGGCHGVMFDSFRDMAWAQNVVAGRLWSDPTLAGQPYWYPPGNPFAFGAVSKAIGVGVVDVYRSSVLWWNALLLVVLFAAACRVGGWVAGILALPMVWLGSLWWLTHVAAPMPSIQSTLLGLVVLLLWHWCVELLVSDEPGSSRRSMLAASLTGAVVALTAWFHPLCALVAAGAIGLHALYGMVAPARFAATAPSECAATRRRISLAVLRVAALGFVLSSPLIVHLVTMPTATRIAFDYFAPELLNPDFAVQAHAPLLPLLGIYGAFRLVRTRPLAVWCVGYLAVGAVGQSLGYLHHWTGLPVPALLPHEFQWHTQLALGITAAFAVVDTADRLSGRIKWPSDKSLARFLWIGLLAVATLSPALPYTSVARSYQIDVTEIERTNDETTAWILRDTDLGAVFATDPLTSYLVIGGLTGRKCVAVPVGHMNPSVDGRQRLDDLALMLATDDESIFARLVDRYEVTDLLIRLTTEDAAENAARLAGFSCLDVRFQSPREGVIVFGVSR